MTTMKTYLREITSLTTCVTIRGLLSKCDCLHILNEFDDEAISAVGTAIPNYWKLLSLAQQSYQMDKVQYSLALTSKKSNNKQGPQRIFILPVSLAASVANSHGSVSNALRQAFQHRICHLACSNLHNRGRMRAKTIRCRAHKMQMQKRQPIGQH